MTDKPKKLPLRQQAPAPSATQQEKCVRALAGLWNRRKAEKIIARMLANGLIDLRFNLKVDDPDPMRIGWWIHKLAELFPGMPARLAVNTYTRLEKLNCLRVNEQRAETKAEPVKVPVRLTATQELALRDSLTQPHGFLQSTPAFRATFTVLCDLGFTRRSTKPSQAKKPPYITPDGKRALAMLDEFRRTQADHYARAARIDQNMMQLREVRTHKLPLGPVSPSLDVSRAKGWSSKGPESEEAKAERIRKLQEGRDRAHAERQAAKGAPVDPFEGTEPTTTVETPQAKKKGPGRPAGSKNKRSGTNKKVTDGSKKKKASKKKASKKKATKKASKKTAKKKDAPGTPNTSSPAATHPTQSKNDPRIVKGQEQPITIEGDQDKRSAALAALSKLKQERGESPPPPVDPFED